MSDPDLSRAGLVVIDKQAGMTSHDVVSKARKLFSTKKIGHAGTLDPMATGVLVLGVDRATKLLGLLSLTTKRYEATIRLGQRTSTEDADGELLDSASAAHLTEETVTGAMTAFVGEINQVPSSVSAIKVDGRRAHALVRAGTEFELEARPVTVIEFRATGFATVPETAERPALLDVTVVVDCSTGTYVRALARDLGEALGVGAHLTALRRTRVGPFDLSHASTLAELNSIKDEQGSAPLSYGIDDAAALAFPHRKVSAQEATDLTHGRWLEAVGNKGVWVAMDPDGRAIALVEESGRRAGSVMVVRPANLAESLAANALRRGKGPAGPKAVVNRRDASESGTAIAQDQGAVPSE